MVWVMADGPKSKSELARWVGGAAIVLVVLAVYFIVRGGAPAAGPTPPADPSPQEAAVPETAPLTVQVNNRNGTGVADAQVRVASPGLWPPLAATTDERGIAEFLEVPVGFLVVQAVKEELVALDEVEVATAENPPPVQLTLESGRIVRGRIVDAAGEPLPGAHAALSMGTGHALPLRATAGEDGRFTIGPAPIDSLTLAAWSPRYVPRVIPVPVTSNLPVRVVLELAATITGTIVDTDGQPISGAHIQILREGLLKGVGVPMQLNPALDPALDSAPGAPWLSGELGVLPGPVPPIPAMSLTLPEDSPDELDVPSAPLGFSDNEGRFTLATVPPGEIRLIVRHADYVEKISDVLNVDPGGESTVRLSLGTGGDIQGIASSADGKPAIGVRVLLLARDGLLLRDLTTGADGRFQIGGVPRTCRLLILRATGKLALRRQLSVPEGKTVALKLTLPPERESVRVVVRGSAGRPISGARVASQTLEPEPPPEQIALTNGEGVATIADARDAGIRVTVTASGLAAQTVTLRRAPEEFHVVMGEGIDIVGRVTAVRGRQNVEGATVKLTQKGTQFSADTDGTGEYRFEGVGTGPAALRVDHADFVPVELTIEVRPNPRRGLPMEVADVNLTQACAVTGEVTDSLGDGVPGIAVSLAAASATAGVDLRKLTTRTDAHGGFSLTQIPPGTVVLEAYSAEHGSGRVELALQAGGERDDVEIRLGEGVAEPLKAAADPVTATLVLTLGERPGGTLGVEVVVVHVPRGGAAHQAGIEEGDAIVRVDGQHPRDIESARRLLDGAPDTAVALVIRRGSDERTVTALREVANP